MMESLFGPSSLALVASTQFALGILFVRRGLDHGDAASGTVISIAASWIVFIAISPLYFEWAFLASPALLIFAAVGLFRPILSTYLSNAATKQIGPTITATVGSVGPLFTVAGGVLILSEPLTAPVAGGTLAIMGGVAMLSWRGSSPRTWAKWALLLPMGSALLRSLAHVMVKLGLEILPEPFMAGLTGYTVSLALGVPWMVVSRRGASFQPTRRSAFWFVLAGVSNALAIMALNVALHRGMVVVVGPLAASFPLFTMLFSALFFRQETINARTLAGVMLIVAGVLPILLFR